MEIDGAAEVAPAAVPEPIAPPEAPAPAAAPAVEAPAADVEPGKRPNCYKSLKQGNNPAPPCAI